jgi:hypothetical protein
MKRRHVVPALGIAFLGLSALVAEGLRGDSTKPDLPKTANPVVAAGKVTWHPTFEAACQASAKSGKPVFLFQMLGRLDQEFC